MNGRDIVLSASGSRYLALCTREHQEAMLDELCTAAETDLSERTRLNACSLASMDLSSSGEDANAFSDLLRLCGKLVVCAGRCSHFRGLLLLNVDSMLNSLDNELRLKALGEMLALCHGLASECVTVLYGPTDEDELFSYADLLDFDGQLRVGAYEIRRDHVHAAEILRRTATRCDTPETEKRLQTVLSDMAEVASFCPDKLVRNCSLNGMITSASLSAQFSDPYSYLGRFMRAEKPHTSRERKIGFHASR